MRVVLLPIQLLLVISCYTYHLFPILRNCHSFKYLLVMAVSNVRRFPAFISNYHLDFVPKTLAYAGNAPMGIVIKLKEVRRFQVSCCNLHGSRNDGAGCLLVWLVVDYLWFLTDCPLLIELLFLNIKSCFLFFEAHLDSSYYAQFLDFRYRFAYVLQGFLHDLAAIISCLLVKDVQ